MKQTITTTEPTRQLLTQVYSNNTLLKSTKSTTTSL